MSPILIAVIVGLVIGLMLLIVSDWFNPQIAKADPFTRP